MLARGHTSLVCRIAVSVIVLSQWETVISASEPVVSSVSGMALPSEAVVAQWDLTVRGDSAEDHRAAVTDRSGNGHDGQLVGTPRFRSILFPTNGAVWKLDGHLDRAFIADDPAFQLTKSLTIEAYIAIDRYPSASAELAQIVFRGDDRPGLDPWFLAVTSQGKLRFLIADATNAASVVQSPAPIPMGPLVHVAATFDHRTGTQSLFVNHQRVAKTKTDIRPAGPLTGPRPGIGIGGWAVHSQQAFAGTIHGVRICRDALTVGQFQSPTINVAAPHGPQSSGLTVVAGVQLHHNVRLDRLARGATVSLGNDHHEFIDVRAPLEGLYYTNRHPYQGAAWFSITADQTVYVAFYGRDWREGGNASGNWQHEINSQAQLQAMGWREVGDLRVLHSNSAVEQESPSWRVFARHCRSGESFVLRNHKYQAPIVIWGHTEQVSSEPQNWGESPQGGFGPAGFGPAGFGPAGFGGGAVPPGLGG